MNSVKILSYLLVKLLNKSSLAVQVFVVFREARESVVKLVVW